MAVRRREAAGAVVHLDDSEGLGRDIGQLLAEDLLHGLPFAGRGRLARRLRSEGEPRRDDQARQCFRGASRWRRTHGWLSFCDHRDQRGPRPPMLRVGHCERLLVRRLLELELMALCACGWRRPGMWRSATCTSPPTTRAR